MPKDTCKSYTNFGEHLNSCKNHKLNEYALFSTPQVSRGGRGLDYTLDFFKNSYENNGFMDYLKHPQKMVQSLTEHPLDDGKQHSPTVLHGLWITNKDHPREINYHLHNFLKQIKKFPGYDILLWSNIDKDTLTQLNPELIGTNITLKNIADLTTSYHKLLDVVLSPHKYLGKRSCNANGLIIDLAKYLIIENEGGILVDLNFTFSEQFTLDNIKPYDFIAANRGFFVVENGFFVSKPHHIIFQGVLNIIEEILFSGECALEQVRNSMSNDMITATFSMMPLAMSYIMHNNQDGNFDVMTSGNCKMPEYKDIPIELQEKLQMLELLSDYINSKNFEHITDFAQSYLDAYGFISQYNIFNCVEVQSIGNDRLSTTWWDAGIIF